MTQIRMRVGNQYVVGEDKVVLSFNPTDGRAVFASAEVTSGFYPAPPYVRPVTSHEGMRAILAEINNAPDPMKAAGEWLTYLTNAITKLIREDATNHE